MRSLPWSATLPLTCSRAAWKCRFVWATHNVSSAWARPKKSPRCSEPVLPRSDRATSTWTSDVAHAGRKGRQRSWPQFRASKRRSASGPKAAPSPRIFARPRPPRLPLSDTLSSVRCRKPPTSRFARRAPPRPQPTRATRLTVFDASRARSSARAGSPPKGAPPLPAASARPSSATASKSDECRRGMATAARSTSAKRPRCFGGPSRSARPRSKMRMSPDVAFAAALT
mmetsp:Transcript_20964/g.69330  ORF Transcript_20964/g.69330 Transcript_20964/m.69330 type:complete len:228 (+) Transcript_20964:1072-1755(+)